MTETNYYVPRDDSLRQIHAITSAWRAGTVTAAGQHGSRWPRNAMRPWTDTLRSPAPTMRRWSSWNASCCRGVLTRVPSMSNGGPSMPVLKLPRQSFSPANGLTGGEGHSRCIDLWAICAFMLGGYGWSAMDRMITLIG